MNFDLLIDEHNQETVEKLVTKKKPNNKIQRQKKKWNKLLEQDIYQYQKELVQNVHEMDDHE